MLGLSNVGSLLEGRGWVRTLELARLVTLVAVCAVLLAVPRFPLAIVGLIAGFGLFSIGWLIRIGLVRGRRRAEPAPA
jgi:hypothetical protein